MTKRKTGPRYPEKPGRTLAQAIVLLKQAEADIAAQRPLVNEALDAIYEGRQPPETYRERDDVFRGAFWSEWGPERRMRLKVYSFGWAAHAGRLTQSWSFERYDGPEDREMLRRIRRAEGPLNPMEQLIWLSEWEGLLGMELAPKVELLHNRLSRERELYFRRGVIMRFISACLDGKHQPSKFRLGKPAYQVRFRVGDELFVTTPDGLVHGDPDLHLTVDPESNIYPAAYARLPSWELQERARKGRQ